MAYPNILIAHRILVTLFLLQYVIKLGLLLLNKKDELAKYTKLTRIAETSVAAAFLITGIWMLVYGPAIGAFMVIKLLCVFAAIPIAIIGFKKSNKALAALSVLLLISAYGLSDMNKKKMAGGPINTTGINDPLELGKSVYLETKCNACHGDDGKLGLAGAKDLSITNLSMDEQKVIIKNGKSSMPGHPDLTDEQLNGLVQYIATFRK